MRDQSITFTYPFMWSSLPHFLPFFSDQRHWQSLLLESEVVTDTTNRSEQNPIDLMFDFCTVRGTHGLYNQHFPPPHLSRGRTLGSLNVCFWNSCTHSRRNTANSIIIVLSPISSSTTRKEEADFFLLLLIKQFLFYMLYTTTGPAALLPPISLKTVVWVSILIAE